MAFLSINIQLLLQEATLAVAAVQKNKRDQKNAPCVVTGTKSRGNFSRKLIHSMKLHQGRLSWCGRKIVFVSTRKENLLFISIYLLLVLI